MKYIRKAIIIVGSVVVGGQILLTNTSCMKKELYDPETVDTIMTKASPVDKVDVTHDWVMTKQSDHVVSINVSVNAKKLQILTEDPRVSKNAEVVNEAIANDGDIVTIRATYPLIQENLYAALVDDEGTYTVMQFDPANIRVDFSFPLYSKEHLTYIPQPQSYVYGYEAEFPEPGDYDYNDIVLHISNEREDMNVVKLNVTLAAVDCEHQLSAAIRLIDYDFEEIDSVKTVGGITFNDGVPSQILTVMTDNVEDLLLKGQHDEAVINLFADAHWATGDNLSENYGVITRKCYNVTKGSDSKNQVIVPRTISYLIYFKDASKLKSFSLDSLDPFIITPYNGGNFEVHLNEYRDAQTLFSYTTHDLKNKHLPWALKIPTGQFRHPLKGVNIGFYIKGKSALFGAYSRKDHAFGNWASDRTLATDWYLYPQENSVF